MYVTLAEFIHDRALAHSHVSDISDVLSNDKQISFYVFAAIECLDTLQAPTDEIVLEFVGVNEMMS